MHDADDSKFLARRYRPAAALLFAMLASLAPVQPAAANAGYESDPRWVALAADHAKRIAKLMTMADDDGYRAQAFVLASRVLELDPRHEAAIRIAEAETPKRIDEGKAPDEKFVKKRDAELAAIGDDLAILSEKFQASGMQAENYYPLAVQALRHGARYGALLESLRQVQTHWLGTWRDKPEADIMPHLGARLLQATWPLEWDDGVARVRARWPAAKAIDMGSVRIFTDLALPDAFALAKSVADLEDWLVTWLPKARKGGKGAIALELLVFAKRETYDKIGAEWMQEDRVDRFKATPRWVSTWPQVRAFSSWEQPTRPFATGRATALGAAAAGLARARLGAGAHAKGRGSWLFSGIAGVAEGHAMDEKGRGKLEPKQAWLLEAAAALRAEGRLLDWSVFLELDEEGAGQHGEVEIDATLAGSLRKAVRLDLVEAQATAFVAGILLADGGSEARFAKLLDEFGKRDRLPDVEKTLGWKKGRLVLEAEAAMDAVAGKP